MPIWKRLRMTIEARTYGSSLLRRLGVLNVFADHPEAYPTVDVVAVYSAAPHLVLLPCEPYPFSERHVSDVTGAFTGAMPVLVAGRDLFWWSVRTGQAMKRIRSVL